jgi:hypothetical protein
LRISRPTSGPLELVSAGGERPVSHALPGGAEQACELVLGHAL